MPKVGYRAGTEAFDVLTAVLTGFADQVRIDGSQPVVLVFPDGGAIRDQLDGRARSHAVLLEALAQQGVPTIDLTDALVQEAGTVGVDGIFVTSGYHYSPRGNAIVAHTLAKQLPQLASQMCTSEGHAPTGHSQ